MLLFLPLQSLHAQEVTPAPPQDSVKRIEIIRANNLRQITTDTGTILNSLAGQAMVRHENTLLSGDSIVFDPESGLAEVFGNVHINDGDTVQTDAGYLRYVGSERKAYLRKKVKLTDKKGIIYADEVVYDIGTGMATYEGGGRVENGSTVLTSRSAVYFSNSNDVYFRRNVHLTDPKYDIRADSLLYNTESQTATFITPTRIKGKDGSIIETRNGVYHLQTGQADFYDRTEYRDSTRSLAGDRIAFEDKSGKISIEGNGKVVDSSNRIVVLGDKILLNKKEGTFLATRKPVMVFYEGGDSTFIAADTLYSAAKKNDSLAVIKKDTAIGMNDLKANDSIRYFLAFHHVRIYNDSMQAAADSMYYSDLDSTFSLFYDPVCWSQQSQISGDTIRLMTADRKPRELRVGENSMVVSRTSEGFFNQVGGRVLNGFFKDGNIDYARMKGSPAEAVYFAQDKDSAYVGMNRSTGDVIDVFFRNRALDKVKFVNNVDGTMFPMGSIPEDKKQLSGFRWQDERRPKSKAALFE